MGKQDRKSKIGEHFRGGGELRSNDAELPPAALPLPSTGGGLDSSSMIGHDASISVSHSTHVACYQIGSQD